MAHDEQRWLTPRLLKAATLCNQTPTKSDSPLWLGIDLGTCDVVSMVVDSDGQPVAVCLDWADVVRDGMRQPHFHRELILASLLTCWSLPGLK